MEVTLTLDKVTHLLLVSDQSRKGIQVVGTIKQVADELVMYDRIGAVINPRDKPDLQQSSSRFRALVTFYIESDDYHAANDIQGQNGVEILQMNDKPNFFVTHCDIPYKITDYTLDSYVKQMRRRVLDPLTEKYGVDTSDAAIRQAVKEHNEVCSIISEIGELRKEKTRSSPAMSSTC